MSVEVPAESVPATEIAFRALAARRLLHTPSAAATTAAGVRAGPSDFDLDPELARELATSRATPAAVLVPVVARSSLSVIFTVRTNSLPSHAGQISFPGGKIDRDDDGPAAAALREAEEEIGLSRRFVEPIGYLDVYRTGTGYAIQPVIALVDPACTLACNPDEVAEVFEVPLAFLLDARNHQRHQRSWQGRERHFYAVPYGKRFIWGATAGIIKNMHERLLQA